MFTGMGVSPRCAHAKKPVGLPPRTLREIVQLGQVVLSATT